MKKIETKAIHTLNSRDNVYLDVFRDYGKATNANVTFEIERLFNILVKALHSKKIEYQNLKRSLTPSCDRSEMSLVFDTSVVESEWYGYSIFEQLIPLFSKDASFSVLSGDCLPKKGFDLFKEFEEKLIRYRSLTFRHETQFFCVYINNLSEEQKNSILLGLKDFEPFIGYFDTTFDSRIKDYLSVVLVGSFIKHGRFIIQGHEDDRDIEEDINMKSYSFEKNGYECKSVPTYLYVVFLDYKIERRIVSNLETDTEFSLLSFSHTHVPLENLEIKVEEAKLEYLKKNKAGSLALADLSGCTVDQLTDLFRKKISSSYIYNLSYIDSFQLSKFNLKIEAPHKDQGGYPVRLLASFEYGPVDKILRLITMY